MMFRPTMNEIGFIGLVVEGFFYGLYSGIFAMYLLEYHPLKKDTNKTQAIIFSCICVLYVLSVVLLASDIASVIYKFTNIPDPHVSLSLTFIQGTAFGCCDFIAQYILIYRCWIVWSRNFWVVGIPSVLAFAFLPTWLAGGNSMYISSGELTYRGWAYSTTLSGLVMSLTVNALVTGLIVLRIFMVFRKFKATSEDQMLLIGNNSGGKFRRIIFILIESGMILFAIQLARLVVTIGSIVWSEAALAALSIIVGIHEMLTGITPTIILVRISLGLSFNDEKSMEEVALGTLRFSSSQLDSVSTETGSISIVGMDRRNDDDDIDVQQSNDIDVVER